MQCSNVYKMLTPGTCTHCDEVAGYAINSFGLWREVWGDSLLFSEHEWDDGNTQNLDGCSSDCLIENGFACNGTFWYEIIKPSAVVSEVSKLNTVTVTVSEPVKITKYTEFVDSLNVDIDGAKRPYDFEYEIIGVPETEGNQTFTSFQIRLFNIKAPLYGAGAERILIWFSDLTAIQDLANNTLSEGRIIGALNVQEYISEDEKANAESSGQSMKYTLMTMFSVNMLLKMVISSSAALMWSLIHVLQVFRYILLININMPLLMGILMQYLAVVVGEVDEIESFVPDLFNEYVINGEELMDEMVLYPKFEEGGYDAPYLTLLFGKQFILFAVFLVFGVPLVYLGVKYVKKIPFISNKLQESWDSFFWNMPLRTLTELYIEISLGFFLNTLNIKLQSASGLVASSIMFAVGLFILFWPFILLSLVCLPPKYVRSKIYLKKYGMLTEDFFTKRTLMQKAYYPLFIFHRMILTGVLVMFYEYPFYQIFMIFTVQVAMIAYVIKVRPFKSELQQVICASDEFVIFFGMIALYFLYGYQDDPVASYRLGLAIIGIIVASLVKNMSVILGLAIKNGYLAFRKWAHGKIGHDKRRRKRLAKERQEAEERKQREDSDRDLLENGIIVDLTPEVQPIMYDYSPNNNNGGIPIAEQSGAASESLQSIINSLKSIKKAKATFNMTPSSAPPADLSSSKEFRRSLPSLSVPVNNALRQRSRLKSALLTKNMRELKMEPIQEEMDE